MENTGAAWQGLRNRSERTSCSPGCGACCIAPSLSSPIPGMPGGKPAGVRCVQLTEKNTCRIHADATRPAVCRSYQPSDLCGASREEALRNLERLERETTGQ